MEYLKPQVLSVGELCALLNNLVQDNFPTPILVEGEVADFSLSARGHRYFLLREGALGISCVLWAGVNLPAKHRLKNGQKIKVAAILRFYNGKGQLQLDVRGIEKAGVGDAAQEFEALKLKLQQEGLFDDERKKTLPQFIQKVALITSEAGAAVRDILARFQGLPIQWRVFNVTVQGDAAPPTIVENLKEADAQDFDVIILARGGGSNTDLSAFNDELVVRTFANLQTPTISGIGHEVDFTLCDFVADCRTSTPTAAAQKVVEIVVQTLALLDFYKKTLNAHFQRILNQKTQYFHLLNARLTHLAPRERLKYQGERLNQLKNELPRLVALKFKNAQNRLRFLQQSLSWKNPQMLLKRGYAMVFDENKHLIFESDSVKKGALLSIRLGQGSLQARVEKIILNEENQP